MLATVCPQALEFIKQGERNIMILGWHTVMAFSPSLIGCIISSGNHPFDLVRGSGACVTNLPTTALIDEVIGIGNSSGREINKFDHFGLTASYGTVVNVPRIKECHANVECRLVDDRLVDGYVFFIWEAVAAQARPTPAYPETLHYTGDGVFMVAGEIIDRRSQFLPQML